MTSDYHRMRHHAGLADLQEWARFDLSGPEAGDALDAVVGCNVRDLFEGRAANTLVPSPEGGVEAIVWVIALADGFRVVGEPADREALRRVLAEGARGRDAVLRDVRDECFALALIGPEAEALARKAFGDDVPSIAFLNALALGDPPVLAARLGYFGEYELHLFGEAAGRRAVIDAIERAGGGEVPMVGQDALPVMMTEMRTMSRERDVPPGVSVFEAGLQWMIDFRKEGLRAAHALAGRKDAVRHKCVLMVADGGAADLGGAPVFVEDHEIGRVRSAFFSPTLGRTVALAYLVEELGMPGLACAVGADRRSGETVSAPAFLGRSILDNLG